MSFLLAEKHLFHLLFQMLKQVFSLANPSWRAVPYSTVTYGSTSVIGALSKKPSEHTDELFQGKSQMMKHFTELQCFQLHRKYSQ